MTLELTDRTTTITRSAAVIAVSIVAKAVATVRIAASRRAQRIALGELLRMEPSRLDDLGISQHDVVEALNARDHAGQHLEQRRSARIDGH